LRSAIVNSIRQSIRQSIRGSGNPVPTFGLPLQNSLDTNIASTRATASFTRATTATFTDYQGQILDAQSNQARIEGNRVVTNLITASEDMTNGAYIASSATIDSATEISFSGSLGEVYQRVTITDDGGGAGARTFTWSVWVRLVSGTISADDSVYLAFGGDAVTDATQNIGNSVTSVSKRFSVTASTDAAGTNLDLQFKSTDTATLEVTKWQLEEVTGSISHAPSEYVSTGIGTGSELVTNGTFDTDSDWTKGTGWTISGGVASCDGSQVSYQSLTQAALTVGKDVVITYDLTVTAGTFRVYAGSSGAGTGRTASGSYTDVITVTGDTNLYLEADPSFIGTIDNVSVKEADHGLNRDGVKAFPYHNGNTKAIRKFLDLDGTGDYASTPSVDVSGSVAIAAYIRPDDWTPTASQYIMVKWDSASTKSWVFGVAGPSNTGKLEFGSSTDGTTTSELSHSTVTTGFTDATGHWVGVVYDGANATFYTSSDPSDTDISSVSWTQLGDPVAHTADPVAISSVIEVGSVLSGASNAFAGQIFQAAAINSASLTATPAIHFNAEDHTSGSTLTSSTTGEVWTFQNDAFISNEETGVVTEATGPAINSSTSQWVELDGTSGCYVSTPDNAASSSPSSTGELDIRVKFVPNDVATTYTLVGKVKNYTNRSYLFNIIATSLQLGVSSDGTVGNQVSANSDAHGFTAGTISYARCTYNATTGEASFYTSQDGEAWVQLGSTQALTPTSIVDNDSPVEIGSAFLGTTQVLDGKVMWAEIYDTIGATTPVVDFNANDYEAGVTWQKVFGGEVATDGSFDNGTTSWPTFTGAGGTVTASNGALNIVSDGASANITQEIGAGTYKITYEITDNTSGALEIGNADDSSGTNYADVVTPIPSTVGTHTVYATLTRDFIYIGRVAACDITLDNVSIEKADIWTLNGTAKAFSPLAKWGDFPGSSGDYISTPDSAAASVTGDMSTPVYVIADDYSNGVQTLLAKYTVTGNQRGYRFDINGTQQIDFYASTNGTNAPSATSAALSSLFTDTLGLWLMPVIDVSASTMAVKYSYDSPWTPYNEITWTTFEAGIAFTSSISGGIYDNTAVVEVGSINAGTGNVFAGTIARAAVFNTTDISNAVPVVDFDARAFTPGVSTAVCPDGATYTVNGNVSIAQNIPSKWDADGPYGYLAEEARTNLAGYSAGLDQTGWSTNNTTRTANSAVAPDGKLTAFILAETTTNSTHNIGNTTFSVTNTEDTTVTWAVKKKSDDWIQVLFPAATFGSNAYANYQFSTSSWGSVGSATTVHPPVHLPNGWVLLSATAPATATSTSGAYLAFTNDTDSARSPSYTGTTDSDIYVAWLQVEQASFPTTYQPTGASSVARNADVLTYSATGNADSFPITVSAEATYSQSVNDAVAINTFVGSSNYSAMQLENATGKMRYVVVDGGAIVADIAASGGVVFGSPVNVTNALNTNDAEFYQDGVSSGTPDTSLTLPNVADTIGVGINQASGGQPNGNIRAIKIFNKRLSDSQVKNL